MDAQVVEVLGRSHLIAQLVAAGLEVARPERDRGIDLVAYADLEASAKSFVATPIQLKAASNRSFSIFKKYEKFPCLVLAYVWNLQSHQETETYALTYIEALRVAEKMEWTLTPTWKTKGQYSTTRPSKGLTTLLEPFRVDEFTWWQKIMKTT